MKLMKAKTGKRKWFVLNWFSWVDSWYYFFLHLVNYFSFCKTSFGHYFYLWIKLIKKWLILKKMMGIQNIFRRKTKSTVTWIWFCRNMHVYCVTFHILHMPHSRHVCGVKENNPTLVGYEADNNIFFIIQSDKISCVWNGWSLNVMLEHL